MNYSNIGDLPRAQVEDPEWLSSWPNALEFRGIGVMSAQGFTLLEDEIRVWEEANRRGV